MGGDEKDPFVQAAAVASIVKGELDGLRERSGEFVWANAVGERLVQNVYESGVHEEDEDQSVYYGAQAVLAMLQEEISRIQSERPHLMEALTQGVQNGLCGVIAGE